MNRSQRIFRKFIMVLFILNLVRCRGRPLEYWLITVCDYLGHSCWEPWGRSAGSAWSLLFNIRIMHKGDVDAEPAQLINTIFLELNF